MKVKINSYKKSTGTSKIKGFASLSLEVEGFPLTINGVKVVQKEDGGVFYSMPDREYITNEGETKYTPYCAFFSREGSAAFGAAVHEGFKEYFKKEPEKQPIPTKNTFDDECPF